MNTRARSIQGECHTILVGVRVRPFNQRELKYRAKLVIEMEGNTTKLYEVRDGKSLIGRPREFVMDYAFWTHDGNEKIADANLKAAPFADQKRVYDALGLQVVTNVFEGYNSCLFAYGQTGSGKTYSMMGIPMDPGILPRVGIDTFCRARSVIAMQNLCTVEASFCELYNEKCRDLLAENTAGNVFYEQSNVIPGLRIREHPQTGIFVEGLSKYDLTNNEEFMMLLEKGFSHRTTACTSMNTASSRSHAIVMITVKQKTPSGTKTGRMCLVDLAGSERVGCTGATGNVAAEGRSINLSLTTLGMCLSRLAEKASGKVGLHIPYRDSSLTYILCDNLGGNSKTSMIATISPACVNYEETLSTLRFASIAKKVKNIAIVNEDPNDRLIRELTDELAQLKIRYKALLEVSRPKQQIAAVPIDVSSTSSKSTALAGKMPQLNIEVRNPNTTTIITTSDEEIDDNLLSLSDSSSKSNSSNSSFAPNGVHLATEEFKELTRLIEDDEAAMGELQKELISGKTLLNVPSIPRLRMQSIYLNKGIVARPEIDLINANRDKLSLIPSNTGANKREDGKKISLNDDDIFIDFDGDERNLCDKDYITEHKKFDEQSNANSIVFSNTMNSEDLEGSMRVNEVHVDWRAPQLVNLMLDEKGGVLVIVLEEGTNKFEIEGYVIFINYDALQQSATVFCATSGVLFLNGLEVEDEGSILRHNDRLVIGNCAYRFAHMAREACDFKTEPINISHLILLERYQRMKIAEERAKNAVSLGKAYFNSLAAITNESAPEMLLTPRGAASSTPRSSNPLLAAIGDELALNNQQVFKLEMELAEEYPIDVNDEVNELVVDDTEYQSAIAEKQRNLMEQREELEILKKELNNRSQSFSYQASPKALRETMIGRREERIVEEDINAMCSEKTLQMELNWHKKVKLLKTFKAGNVGPVDKIDNELWKRLQNDPPYLTDPMIKIKRSILTSVSDQQVDHGRWHTRYVCCSQRFLYVFKESEDSYPCINALYLLGCTVNNLVKRKALFQDAFLPEPSNADLMTDSKTLPFVISLAPAVPRSPADTSLSSDQSSIKLGFTDARIANTWLIFFRAMMAPPMPISMLKRWTKDKIATQGSLDVILWEDSTDGTTNLPIKMRWKPNTSVNSCEECKKSFFLFRKRHHCHSCGGIFCNFCLTPDKKCSECASVVRKCDEKTVSVRRRNVIIPEIDLPHFERLRESYKVHIDAVPVPDSDATNVMSKYRRNSRLSQRDLRDSLLARFAPDADKNGYTRFCVDHYAGRAYTILGDEIRSVERSMFNPLRLCLKLKDDTTMNLTFVDAYQRERCMESLVVLMGQRVYMTGVPEIVEYCDTVITNDIGEDSFVRATNQLTIDVAMWVGTEDGRPVPLHQNYDLWVFVGHRETWSQHTVKMYRLTIVASAPLATGAQLYIIVSQDWLSKVVSHSACAVQANEYFTMCAIGLRLLETSILFIAADIIPSRKPPPDAKRVDIQTFKRKESSSSLNRYFSLAGISTMNLPPIDTLQQYEHIILINAPAKLLGVKFAEACKIVKYRSQNITVMQAGRTACEMVVPCVNFQFSKCSNCPQRRLLLNLDSLEMRPEIQTKNQQYPISELPKGNIANQCQLWCSMGFDRYINNEVVSDPRALAALPASAGNLYGAILLTQCLPEFYDFGKIFIAVSDIGSIAVSIARCLTSGTIKLEVCCEGKRMAIADVTIKADWISIDSIKSSDINYPQRRLEGSDFCTKD